MHWTCRHHLDSTLERVEAVLLDPSTPEKLPEFAPRLREVHSIHRTEGDGWIERVAHYRPELSRLPPAISPRMIEFDERTRWDCLAHQGHFVITPCLPPRLQDRFQCAGIYSLSRDGRRTLRTVEGEIRIDALIIGPAMERLAIQIIRRQFDHEARMLGALA